MCFPCFVSCVNNNDMVDDDDDDDDQWWKFITLNLKFYRFHDTREFLGEQST